MKSQKFLYSIITASLLLSCSNVFAADAATSSTEFEKQIAEESVAFIEKENRLIDLYLNYMLGTGKKDYINFLLDENVNLIPSNVSKYLNDNNKILKDLTVSEINTLFFNQKTVDLLTVDQTNVLFSNNIFKSFNSVNQMKIDFNGSTINVIGSITDINSVAKDTFIKTAESYKINYSFDKNGQSVRIVKLNEEMINLLVKLELLLADGGIIIPYDKISDVAYIKTKVPNNSLFYVAKSDYTVDVFQLVTNAINYKGNISNFNGIVLKSVADLSKYLPQIAGSVGYVLVDNLFSGTSQIEEYIYDGSVWKPKFESLNTQLQLKNTLNKLTSVDTIASNLEASANVSFVSRKYDNQYIHGTRLNHYLSYGTETNKSADPLYGNATYNTSSSFTYPTYSTNESLSASPIIRSLDAIKTPTTSPSFIAGKGACCWVSTTKSPSLCEKYSYTCSYGGTYNRTSGKCEFAPACPQGFYYNGTTCIDDIVASKNDNIVLTETANNKLPAVGKYEVSLATEIGTYVSSMSAIPFYFETITAPTRAIYNATGSGTNYSCRTGDTKLWTNNDIVTWGTQTYIRVTPTCQEAKLTCPVGTIDTYNNGTTCVTKVETCNEIQTKYGAKIDAILASKIATHVYNYNDYVKSQNIVYTTGSNGKCASITKTVNLDNNYYVEPYVSVNYKYNNAIYGTDEINKTFRDFTISEKTSGVILPSGTNQDLMDDLNNGSGFNINAGTNPFGISAASYVTNAGGELLLGNTNFKKILKTTVVSPIIFEDSIINLDQGSLVKELQITE